MIRSILFTAGLAGLAFVGYKVNGALDGFFYDNPWVSTALIVLTLLCVVAVVVAIAAGIAIRALAWGAQGMIVRVRNDESLALLPALLAEARVNDKRARMALELAGEQHRLLLAETRQHKALTAPVEE